MPRSAAEARDDLIAMLGRNLEFTYLPRTEQRGDRRSAVLVLFGALDRTPAEDQVSSVPPELDVLLMRRADRARHHAGEVSFPGGGFEPGDDDLAVTALREAHEETGLDPAGVEVLGLLPEVNIPVSRNDVTPVIGWWQRPSQVAADDTESAEVFRVPVAELLSPQARGTAVYQRPGSVLRTPGFELAPHLGGHLVWGFTAFVLAQLFDELGWAVQWDRFRELPVN